MCGVAHSITSQAPAKRGFTEAVRSGVPSLNSWMLLVALGDLKSCQASAVRDSGPEACPSHIFAHSACSLSAPFHPHPQYPLGIMKLHSHHVPLFRWHTTDKAATNTTASCC